MNSETRTMMQVTADAMSADETPPSNGDQVSRGVSSSSRITTWSRTWTSKTQRRGVTL